MAKHIERPAPETGKPRCPNPKCRAQNVYIRSTDQTIFCRRCGYDSRKREEEQS